MTAPSRTSPAPSLLWARNFFCHLLGVGAWFWSVGLQFVLVPTAVVVVLGGSALDLGAAQLAMFLPNLLLLLLGGVLADKRDGRVWLLQWHVMAMLPPLWMAFRLWSGQFQYSDLILYALAMGAVTAFVMPARDAMLTRVAASDLQRGVLLVLFVQFATQIGGYVLAGALALAAPVWSLAAAQLLCLGAGAAALAAMHPLAPQPSAAPDTAPASQMTAFMEGWRAVWRSPRLYPVMLAMSAVGLFFIGAFLVMLPIMATTKFGGGQFEISLTSLCFWGGTIITTVILMLRRPIARRGRAMCISLSFGTVILAATSFAPNFASLCALCILWGMNAGVTMVMSRTVVQTKAPARLRARVLALYSLSFMGGAPAGALGMGLIIEMVGLDWSPFLPAAAMLVFLAWLMRTSPLWRLR